MSKGENSAIIADKLAKNGYDENYLNALKD
jgi:hypothetical protein